MTDDLSKIDEAVRAQDEAVKLAAAEAARAHEAAAAEHKEQAGDQA